MDLREILRRAVLLAIMILPAADISSAETQASSGGGIRAAAELFRSRSYQKAEDMLLGLAGSGDRDSGMARFLLGKLYLEQGSPGKAAEHFTMAAEEYPLLRDYALKYLVDIYKRTEEPGKVVETSRKIRSSLLAQSARQAEISALISLGKKDEALQALSNYVGAYPADWDHKLTFAMHLKDSGETERAVAVLKDIYIHAAPPSNSALSELKKLKGDSFTKDELRSRADSLFEKNNFERAETEYQNIYRLSRDDAEKDRVRFSIGMCQFRTKQYTKAAATFSSVDTPEALHYQGWAYHRTDNRAGFEKAIKEFAEKYPSDDRLALLLLMDADAFRSAGDLTNAAKRYQEVVTRFPEKSEDALWGLAWMRYVNGEFDEAHRYFSQLVSFQKSDNYYKHLYWNARSMEKAAGACGKRGGEEQAGRPCEDGTKDFFSGLPADNSFYGYLIRMRAVSAVQTDKAGMIRTTKPEGELYDRIEALALAGMDGEAVSEIIPSLRRGSHDFWYLANRAMELGEYRRIIALTERETESEFLPYSYPFGFGEHIEEAASRRNIDKYLVAAVIREESRFDPQALSWAGARGLMQLMPATAYGLKKELKLQLRDRTEIHDPQKNILMGTHYLSGLMREYSAAPLAIAAYNAGERPLKKWMAKYGTDDLIEFIENIPYRETRYYVKRVLKSYWRYRSINGLPVEGHQVFAAGSR